MSSSINEEEVKEFLENLSTSNFEVSIDDLMDAYDVLQNSTNNFQKVTKDSVASAIISNRDVIEEVLRLSSSFQSLDSWTTLLKQELQLETKSNPSIFNEIQRKLKESDSFKEDLFDFLLDLLGEDLKGNKKDFSHRDIVAERYIVGKGSALRGQASGNWLEDKVKESLENIDLREGKDFVHVDGRAQVKVGGESYTFEKGPDFVIPDLNNARILIEAKAYVSSTGSKQTDVLGDINKFKQLIQKGVKLFMALDGPMWRRRVSDLREVFKKKNSGIVEGIYQVKTLHKMESHITQILKEIGI